MSRKTLRAPSVHSLGTPAMLDYREALQNERYYFRTRKSAIARARFRFLDERETMLNRSNQLFLP